MHLTRELVLLVALWLALAVLVAVELLAGGDVALAVEAWCGGVVSTLIVMEVRR